MAAEETARRKAEKQARLEANPTRKAAIAAYRQFMRMLLGEAAAAPRMDARTEIRGGMARTVFASGEATPWANLADELAKAEATALDFNAQVRAAAAKADKDKPTPTVESSIWDQWRKRRG